MVSCTLTDHGELAYLLPKPGDLCVTLGLLLLVAATLGLGPGETLLTLNELPVQTLQLCRSIPSTQ